MNKSELYFKIAEICGLLTLISISIYIILGIDIIIIVLVIVAIGAYKIFSNPEKDVSTEKQNQNTDNDVFRQ